MITGNDAVGPHSDRETVFVDAAHFRSKSGSLPMKNALALIGYLWTSPNTIVALAIGLLLGGRFQRVNGIVEIDGERIAKVLASLPVSATAMTVGHAVFGRDQSMLDRTRKHERVHVEQFARWGPLFIPAYLGCSLWLYLRGRDGYRENPFEIEAYAIDELEKPEKSSRFDNR
jgi:hypothetical protein